MFPNWLLQLTWFLASVCATGAFWYFLSQKNQLGTQWTGFGAIVFVLLAVTLHIRNGLARRARAAPSRLVPALLPESGRGASGEPFLLTPAKRRGPPKANGESDIYMGIRVSNKGTDWIRGCRGRLVRVRHYVTTPDGVEKQDIPHISPAYLRWSPGDGGGVSADFCTEATLDVAVIESWGEPIYQLMTADEGLRPTYRLDFKPLGPILTIEIAAESGGRVERTLQLDGDFRMPRAGMEPLIQWREWP
jgi:hypothetical protein